MPNSTFYPTLFFTLSVDGLQGFISSFNEVPGGSLTVIPSEAYSQYTRAGHDNVYEHKHGPIAYFRDTGLENHPQFKNLSIQEMFETSFEGQAIMAREAAAMLAQKYPQGIPHRIMMHLKNWVMDEAKHAVSQAEVACDQYQEESEQDVVAKMLAILLRTRQMDRILDAAGEPANV